MPRFFIQPPISNSVVITGDDARHIGRSLRMKLGDELILCENGTEHTSIIETISDTDVMCRIVKSERSKAEPSINLTLYQAMPKADKLELIVQKAVELGVTQITPVLTKRCVSRPDKKSFAKKRERLQKIALEAAKQSGRGIIPLVTDIISTEECINEMAKTDFPLVCYEKGGINLCNAGLKENSLVSIFIGSEGGFDEDEIIACKENGIVPIGLGSRILRCETAPIAAISIIMNITSNM